MKHAKLRWSGVRQLSTNIMEIRQMWHFGVVTQWVAPSFTPSCIQSALISRWVSSVKITFHLLLRQLFQRQSVQNYNRIVFQGGCLILHAGTKHCCCNSDSCNADEEEILRPIIPVTTPAPNTTTPKLSPNPTALVSLAIVTVLITAII